MLKNNPSSRKLTTFDSRRKSVKKFEMIGEETLLAELQPDDPKEKTYWCMMDLQG